MRKLLVITLILLLVSGCASTPLDRMGSYTSIEQIDYPETGSIVVASIGDRLVSRGNRESGPFMNISAPTVFNKAEGEASIMTCGITVQPNSSFKKGEKHHGGIEMSCFGPFMAILTASDGTTNLNCNGRALSGYVCSGQEDYSFVAGSGVFPLKQSDSAISVSNSVVERQSNFVQELVYNGRSGNTVRFLYREFSNNIARPAFTQDVQYDLSDSSVIGFRDLRMEVIEASNTDITYRLLSNF